MTGFRPTRDEVIALVAALAGFVVHVGESGRTVVNGRVTESHDYNYAAVVLGAIAVAMVARLSYRMFGRPASDGLAGPVAMHYAALAVIGLLGVYQVVHGLDVV